MAQNVYSTLFIDVDAINFSTGYAVPAGHIAILRDIAVYFDGSPGDTAVSVRNLATGGFAYYHLMVDANEYDHWEGRQVFGAGSTISAASAGPNACAMRACGYLLTLP